MLIAIALASLKVVKNYDSC